MKKLFLFSCILTLTIILSFSADSAFAHPHHGNVLINNHAHKPSTEIIPINSMIGLEKSTIFFHAPPGNTLPWGFVEGKVANHVEGYPVIIQIFKNNDAVHFAQTDIGEDGVYEYKFRILNSDKNHITKIFEGDYSVKIFKVVYLNQENII